MPQRSWQLVVLDMAGTTVRDDGMVEASVAAAVDAVEPGRVVTACDFVEARGLPKIELFGALFGRDHPDAEKALAVFEQDLLARAAAGAVTAVDGAPAALEALRTGGAAVYLATGFPRAVTDAIIASLGWGDLADGIVVPDTTLRGRPHPDLILSAALAVGVDAVSRIAVVGDTVNDLRTAANAGAGAAIGVLTGAHDRARLETVPHTAIVDSIADVPATLAGS
ncbi:HAD family hydrolase [Saccharopolyspora hattusasensis]|uniref:HAD family hydrolase n=1 Tax=Saccharopolyspora hattusasensis TaxID=1128679 RepID=UPI003D9904B5